MGFFSNLSNILKYGFLTIMAALVFGVGFYIGRKTINIPEPGEPEVVYVPMEPIHDSIPKPVPYKVVEPADTLSIIKQCIADGIYQELWPKNTVHDTVASDIDTNQIIKDWAARRYYSEELFNIDTVGQCIVNAEVQYNRLDALSYEYMPKMKEVQQVVYTSKKYAPFVGTGVSINPWDENPNPLIEINGGMFYKDKYGLQLKYQKGTTTNKDYIGATALFKF